MCALEQGIVFSFWLRPVSCLRACLYCRRGSKFGAVLDLFTHLARVCSECRVCPVWEPGLYVKQETEIWGLETEHGLTSPIFYN